MDEDAEMGEITLYLIFPPGRDTWRDETRDIWRDGT